MLIKRTILVLNLCLCLASSLWAGCGGGYRYYKGDWGRSTGDGCAGSLRCVEPMSRMHCTDPYCFYPPPDSMSQARCCRDFGNMGDIHNPWGIDDERS